MRESVSKAENRRSKSKRERREKPPEEKIRRRAYEIYKSRGSQHGRALDDWFEALDEFEGNDRS